MNAMLERLLHFPLTLLLLTIILKVHGMQMRHYHTAFDPTPAAGPAGEGFGDLGA